MTEVITTRKGICIVQNYENCQNFDYGMNHMKDDNTPNKKSDSLKLNKEK